MKMFFYLKVLLMIFIFASCDSLNINEEGNEADKKSVFIFSIDGDHLSFPKEGEFYREGDILKSNGLGKDTNDFILKVYSTQGTKVYHGKYGSRPKDFMVLPGGYEISLYSREPDSPKFDSPVFGDMQTVIVKDNEQISIKLRCRQISGGVRFIFSEDIKKRFPGTGFYIEQTDGSLEYKYGETRYAHLSTEGFSLIYKGMRGDTILLHKQVSEGQMITMKLSYSIPDGYNSTFRAEIDTTREWLTNNYNLGFRIPTGVSTIEEAKRLVGEKNVAVFGFIYGGDPTNISVRIAPPFTSTSSFVMAQSIGERNRNNSFVIELPAGKIRDELNLVGYPGHLGRAIVVTGEIVPSYFNYIGMKGTKAYAFIK